MPTNRELSQRKNRPPEMFRQPAADRRMMESNRPALRAGKLKTLRGSDSADVWCRGLAPSGGSSPSKRSTGAFCRSEIDRVLALEFWGIEPSGASRRQTKDSQGFDFGGCLEQGAGPLRGIIALKTLHRSVLSGGAGSGDDGGAEGNRTPDLVIANDALSQLSYGPVHQRCPPGSRPRRGRGEICVRRARLSSGCAGPGGTPGLAPDCGRD